MNERFNGGVTIHSSSRRARAALARTTARHVVADDADDVVAEGVADATARVRVARDARREDR